MELILMEFTILVLGVGVVVSVVRIRISMRGTNNKKNKKISRIKHHQLPKQPK